MMKPPPHRSLNDRISAEKAQLLVEASRAPPGPALNEMVRKLRHLDLAASLNKLLSASALRVARPQGDPDSGE
jgi:hypothetical protein